MQKDSLRVAHLSDPHFSKTTLSPSQFLSKRWMGNLNQFLFRKHAYYTHHLWHLPELLTSLDVEAVFITGDFSSTSLSEEFTQGARFVQAFRDHNLPTYTVPGNHDCYTREASQTKSYYQFFPSEALQTERIELISLGKNWWYVGLDCAVSAPLFCAYGHFFPATERALEKTLRHVPPQGNVIIANHFPLFGHNRPKHDLKRGSHLQALLKRFPQVKLYLHGHDHKHYVVDRQLEGFPLVLNSGSCAHKPNGTFYLIDLFAQECLVQRLLFSKTKETFSWVMDWQRRFVF